VSEPEVGNSEGKKALGTTGDKSIEGKKRKRARFRRRVSLPRRGMPSVPKVKSPKATQDLRFRATTRMQALGYWLREKAQAAWELIRRAAAAVAHWWSGRSRGTRLRIFAAAGVVLLYLIIKFLPVPGVPCEVSAAKECAPSNETIAYVPRDAVLYAHLTVNSSSHQWELARDLQGLLPNFAALVGSDTSALAAPGGPPIDLPHGVLPWAKDDLALLGVPGPKKTTAEAYIVGVGDDAKANQFLNSLSSGGAGTPSSVGGASLSVHRNGFATARSGDQVLFGSVVAVRAALASKAGQAPRLEGSEQDAARAALPDVRLAELYLSRVGVSRMLAGRAGSATQLNTFVDYGATTGMAVSMRARDDGVDVDLVSDLDPKLEQRSPTVFANLPRFEPGLANEAGPDALGYIGVGDLGPTLTKSLETAGASAQGLAGSLRTLAQSLQQQAGVDPLKDLLPALDGEAALVAEPTGGVPYASLIVDGVDEKKAGEALASLQQPLLKAAATGGSQVPSFQSKEIDGVAVHSVQISPSVNLSYAIFDGKLVISTQPEGISQVRSSGDNLAGTGAYQTATDHLPDSVSALVFLNLNEVLGLAQKAGLAEDPLYASLSEDISHVQSLGLAVRGSNEQLRSELFLAIDH
jgi:Protein of unknown function (DUF3352)